MKHALDSLYCFFLIPCIVTILQPYDTRGIGYICCFLASQFTIIQSLPGVCVLLVGAHTRPYIESKDKKIYNHL
jgi:hypothetical protein